MELTAGRGLRRVGALLGSVLAAAVTLGACTPATSTGQQPASRGGTLTLLSATPIATLDPQRVADPTVAALLGRTLHRTLTAYAPSSDASQPARLVGDLATDTGTPSADLKTWRFTLRNDVRWQDGTAVTCADVKHGIARTFATDVVAGAATDALAVLAVPRTAEGKSTFAGPYAAVDDGDAGKASFDKAVACDGSTITFTLSDAVSDFNDMLTLPTFAPVKKDGDPGPTGTLPALSDGPYQVDGTWNALTGGVLVRNPRWSPASDPIRKAHPDRIALVTGGDAGAIMETVLADGTDAQRAVALTPAPPSLQLQVAAVDALRARSLTASTGVVDYVVPNVRSAVFANPQVRVALEKSTNRAGYAAALGPAFAVRPHGSVLPEGMRALASSSAPASPSPSASASLSASASAAPSDTGAAAASPSPPASASASATPSAAPSTSSSPLTAADPVAARAALTAAGMTLPVPMTVAYRPSPAADKAMAALVAGWQAAGFAPTLKPIADTYFPTIAAPTATDAYDVFWSNWSPAWDSASTVLPPLFDSSFNLTTAGTGRDYGAWSNTDWNAHIRTIAALPDATTREHAWAAADATVRADGAYVALAQRYAVHVAGSEVRGLSPHPFGGGTVDLAVIGVTS